MPDGAVAPQVCRWQRSILTAVALWAATRLTFLVVGIYSARLSGSSVAWLGMWTRWDSGYYLSIAGQGYQPPSVLTGLESGQSNVNFFPMLPILIALFHLVIPSVRLAGLMAANVSLLIAAIALHRLANRRCSLAAADWAVISLMTLPGSFALSAPLSESVFLAFSILAASLVPARNNAAALFSALLTITRWTGILQGLGLALDWLTDRIRGRDASYQRLLAVCLVPVPLLLFLGYMFYLTGDALAPLHSNFAFWHQRFGVPFQSLVVFVHTGQPRLELQSALALLLVTITLSQMRMFTPGEVFFVIASIASFASSDAASASLVRYTIGLYPVHLAIGRLCGHIQAMRILLLCLAMIGAAIAVFWFQGSDVYV